MSIAPKREQISKTAEEAKMQTEEEAKWHLHVLNISLKCPSKRYGKVPIKFGGGRPRLSDLESVSRT
jgi:hypothetical protein